MSVLLIILSILMIICGINCIVTPVSTFSALGWIAGVAIIIAGVSAIFRYAAGKVNRSIWDLIGGIVSIVCGVFITINSFAHFAINIIIAYAVAIWLLIYGITGIADAFSLKKMNKALPNRFRTASWLVVLILGILTAVLGVVCIFKPMITFFSVGILIGVSILISGVKTLVLAIQTMTDK